MESSDLLVFRLSIWLAFLGLAACTAGGPASTPTPSATPPTPATDPGRPTKQAVDPSPSPEIREATAAPSSSDGSLPAVLRGRDLNPLVDAWTVYQNDGYRFSFEYPLIYDEIPSCALRETIMEDGTIEIQIGTRIQLVAFSDPQSSLEEYISSLTEGAENVRVAVTPVAGVEGHHVSYRYGGLGRLQEVYLADVGSLRLALGFTAPWACDFPVVNIWEPEAFSRAVESLNLY